MPGNDALWRGTSHKYQKTVTSGQFRYAGRTILMQVRRTHIDIHCGMARLVLKMKKKGWAMCQLVFESGTQLGSAYRWKHVGWQLALLLTGGEAPKLELCGQTIFCSGDQGPPITDMLTVSCTWEVHELQCTMQYVGFLYGDSPYYDTSTRLFGSLAENFGSGLSCIS